MVLIGAVFVAITVICLFVCIARSVVGDADPNGSYNLSKEKLQVDLREEAGMDMTQQDAVVSTKHKNDHFIYRKDCM